MTTCVRCGGPNNRSDPTVPYPFCSARCTRIWDAGPNGAIRPAIPKGRSSAMRTFTRFLINVALLAGTAAAIAAAVASDAYKHASHDMKTAIPLIIAAAGFILACLVLKVVPAKKKAAKRPSSPYAAPARR